VHAQILQKTTKRKQNKQINKQTKNHVILKLKNYDFFGIWYLKKSLNVSYWLLEAIFRRTGNYATCGMVIFLWRRAITFLCIFVDVFLFSHARKKTFKYRYYQIATFPH
jgi:hypothetical protein